MPDPDNTPDDSPKKGGQILGCVFAAGAALFFFFAIFVFMRACG
jgi:hypothetical protein